MKQANRKETAEKSRQSLTECRRQDEETADERDLISSLPLDLKLQILVKLQPKSIAQLISVSKLWSSIIRGKDFMDLFISRSSARPNFLFSSDRHNTLKIHTCSQKDPSSSDDRKISITIPKQIVCISPPVRGLICGQEIDNKVSKVICNPSTGQFVTLPRVKIIRRSRLDDIKHFFGYDPVNDQYKVLCMRGYDSCKDGPYVSEEHQVFTLGAEKKEWRMIQCKYPHYPATNELCRDGVVYYGAWYNIQREGSVIVSFDVRYEDFGVIKLPEDVKFHQFYHTVLANYHGKIALVEISSYTGNVDLWILQDVKKQEWSNISFLLPNIARTSSEILFFRGTISTGEIIFAPSHYTTPFFLVYYDLKLKNARRVYIQGVRDGGDAPITVFMDHVKSPMFLQHEV